MVIVQWTATGLPTLWIALARFDAWHDPRGLLMTYGMDEWIVP